MGPIVLMSSAVPLPCLWPPSVDTAPTRAVTAVGTEAIGWGVRLGGRGGRTGSVGRKVKTEAKEFQTAAGSYPPPPTATGFNVHSIHRLVLRLLSSLLETGQSFRARSAITSVSQIIGLLCLKIVFFF